MSGYYVEGPDHEPYSVVTASSPRPAAADTTGGELRAQVAQWLFASRTPDRYWGNPSFANERDDAYADANELLALPALRDLLAAAAKVQAVEELHAPIDRGTGPQCQGCATNVTFTRWPCDTLRALGTPTTGGGE